MSRINSLLVSCMMLVVLTGCPVNPCLKPAGTTNCITACAAAANPRRSCNSCCNAKPQTPQARQQCFDACNTAYGGFAIIANPVEEVRDVEATEVIVESETVNNSLSACSCERIVPCDTSITQPVLMAIPEFWRTVTIANFICYLSPAERSELLMDVQNTENWVFGRSQAEFDAQMAILDAAVIEIMAANEVEGSAHDTFYMNN